MTLNLNNLITHLKETGFIYPSSEIYGGLANSWDYGPLGVALKNNLKRMWWRNFITQNPLNVGLDSSIILNPQVWIASGHVASFADPLIECKKCHHRFRADDLITHHFPEIKVANKSHKELKLLIDTRKISCLQCQSQTFSDVHQFDLMFKTAIGPVATKENVAYLRPETAQGIFINFKTVQRSLRKNLPFGIGQIGKTFRNEITPGNFIFRTREFEQMELEFFYDSKDGKDWFNHWLKEIKQFLSEEVCLDSKNYRISPASTQDLAHYARKTVDVEYRFPFGWQELWGLSDRGGYDLEKHQRHSGETLGVYNPDIREYVIPHVIEPSVGVERLMLALLCDSFKVETTQGDNERVVLKLPPQLAPYQLAILPLQKAQSELSWSLYERLLREGFVATYDDKGSIGKRYRRQDSIGTPFIVTVDFDLPTTKLVTVRHRDTREQESLHVEKLSEYLRKQLI